MKSIDGAPETITHAQVVAAVEALGFDTKQVRAIKMSPWHVEVVMYATTPVKLMKNGLGYTDDPATHTIYYDLFEPTVDD